MGDGPHMALSTDKRLTLSRLDLRVRVKLLRTVMRSEQWARIKEHFASAVELNADDRDAFVASMDAADQAEVRRLLENYDKAQDFIEEPAAAVMGVDAAGESMIGKRIDDYSIVGQIGAGGMGNVYLAEHQADGLSHRV